MSLRHLRRGEAGLSQASDVIVDQIRAIDNARLIRRLGSISARSRATLSRNIQVMLA
ncbi:MAG: type II toxin-antitoxin system PemK/MazF family toxin [Planctomycetes bacterium]|nr:type II toxin-antitoxin system PemK/MazF family toxin [Planctomycetota bacterium]